MTRIKILIRIPISGLIRILKWILISGLLRILT